MTSKTPRFEIPLLVAGQGQKDVTHNEALLAIDLLAHPQFESRTASTPPTDAQPGQMWIVPAEASGAWAGHEGRIAAWTDGGWRFLQPAAGISGWLGDEGLRLRWTGTMWRQEGPAERPPVALEPPSGGAVADVEARTAIVALQSVLRSLGFVT